MKKAPAALIRIFFFCWLFSSSFLLSALLVDLLILDSTLSLAAMVIISPLCAVPLLLLLGLGHYRYTPTHYFTSRAAIRWIIYGGLAGLSVLPRRLLPLETVFHAFVIAGISPAILIVSYWIAFRLYPLRHQEEIKSEGEHTP